MKTCIKCLQLKPRSEFNRHRKYQDGLYSICKICHRFAARQWELKNPERVKTRLRAEYLANRAQRIKRAAEWYKNNRERALALRRSRFKRNPSKVTEELARRRAARLNATPAWASRTKMEQIYRKAKELRDQTGHDYQVDHIAPLISPLVCGLHCEFNLQIIMGKDNFRKGNRTWPDMPEVASPGRGE